MPGGVILDREERKAGYLKSFIHAFSENGIDKTSIKKLACAASINEASIYQYFKNKDEIIINCVDYYFEMVETELRPILLDVGQTMEYRLRKILRYLDEVSQQEKFIIQVLTNPVYSHLCEPIMKKFTRNQPPLCEKLASEFSVSQEVVSPLLYLFYSMVIGDKIINDREILTIQFEYLLHLFQKESK
jgi:AcrR family transcriptional regulator